jgi:transposase
MSAASSARAHLKRDFQAFAERAGQSAEIGRALLAQVKELFTYWHEWRGGRRDWPSFQRVMQPVQARVEQLLEQGAAGDHAKTASTCRQILKRETALWTFARVAGVEPTNNAAERSLRRAVLWRRKSCGTQSAAGSQFVERILTAVTTLGQQGRDVLAWLTAACMAATGAPTPCCLLPDTS